MSSWRKKLKDSSGSSLVLAMAFILLCTLVGSAVLAAATVGAGQGARRETEEQRYLSQRSAAEVLCAQFYSDRPMSLRLERNGTKATITLSREEGAGSALERRAVEGAIACHLSGVTELSFTGFAFEDVDVTYDQPFFEAADAGVAESFTLTEPNGGTVHVKYSFEGASMCLSFCDEEGEDVSVLSVYVQATAQTEGDITTITWAEPVIRKGGAA